MAVALRPKREAKPMKSKLRVLLLSLALPVLLAGALQGCSGSDNPTIPEVKNVSDLNAQGKNDPTIVRGKVLKKGEGYMRAFDPELRKKQQ